MSETISIREVAKNSLCLGLLATAVAGCGGLEDSLMIEPKPTPAPTETVDPCVTHHVRIGDNLWNIAEIHLGDGSKYEQIARDNDDRYPTLRKSTVIEPGMVLRVCHVTVSGSDQGESIQAQYTQIPTKPIATQIPEGSSPPPTGIMQEQVYEMIGVSFDRLPDPSPSQLMEAIAGQGIKDFNQEIQKNISNSTVLLTVDAPDGQHQCSGIHIGGGRIVTADHCFGQFSLNELTLEVRGNDGAIYKPIGLSGAEGIDFAVVQLEDHGGLSSVSMEDTSDVPLGDTLFVNSLTTDNDDLWQHKYRVIYVGGAHDTKFADNTKLAAVYARTLPYSFIFFAGNKVLKPGFSGSGVFNSNGELVGVLYGGGRTTLGTDEYSTGYAIRSELIQRMSW